ncbi:heterocyst formation ABC transporter subunit HepA [Chroogloeocystis siderophila]|jgi:subfamily B ATP-binding cassette protein MsbA|uniref:ABC transporter ATP-binding protein n=1 Tax=Chroogloeocystis siderophila 5.2 s.c.1 TaxID=247279 RepID=A0A1U7HH12_9CHRO|nr:heterocyst formation ABC transporter subunit HepA [Chroogloeocystis siderophila]OKH22873.1 ABC transporter ATP-binding protein [Chroogloeocystis siderophila 5.2 s.c.1]
MNSRISQPFRNLLSATKFWQENYFLIREFRNFRSIAVLAIVFTIVAALFEGIGVGFILSFLQNLTNPNAQPIRTGIEWFDIWFLGVNMPASERVYRVCGLILLTTLLRSLFTYLGRLYTQIAQFKLVYFLRKRVFELFQSLSLRYFAKTRSGGLVHSITTEIMQLMQAFNFVSVILTKFTILFVYIISMLLLSWQLTIVTVLLFSLVSVGMTALLGRVREASFERTRAAKWYTSISLEYIHGIRTVQAFAAYNFERKRFDEANSNFLKATTKAVSVSSVIEPLSEGVATAILVGMLLLAFSVLIPSGQLQVSSLLTFLFVLLRIMPVRRQIDGARVQLSNCQGSFNNIRELLQTEDKPFFHNGNKKFVGLKRAIEFVKVDFGYDADEIVLHNINLTIEKGKMTALVGASGAGKSTLADLIPRFYDPTHGQVLIDGVDLREFNVYTIRNKLAVVSQDTYIFNTSVRENIAYALENVDDAAVVEAAKLANALEFIQELPQGFETQLGDRGVRLSGGQRQRIAIARALLRNPEILILDEATSALDSVSERLIQQSLEKLAVGRTVIAIAHRLSTIVRADKVVVLEQGRIVEQGGYQELLDQRGELWKYHQMQHEYSQAG